LQPACRSWLRYHQNGGRHQRRRYHKPFHWYRYSPEFSLFKSLISTSGREREDGEGKTGMGKVQLP
jgi:hypothetical protein